MLKFNLIKEKEEINQLCDRTDWGAGLFEKLDNRR